MNEHVTLLRPDARSQGEHGISSSLPPDLLEQVRGRMRVLALLMLFGFSLDPFFYFGSRLVVALNEGSLPSGAFRDVYFYLGDIGVIAASAALWWIAPNRRISATRLHSYGMLYEVGICFVLSLRTFWEYYRDTGILPNLTWVPVVVILFPLLMPARPRLVLVAAIAAGTMPLVALFLLNQAGEVKVDIAYAINTGIMSGMAVGFAYMGSRVVYGLGRQVAAARELGSYRLEVKLGQGGMGEVWRARHRMLARPAAIKLIRPSLTAHPSPGVSQDAVLRFEREAQAIARLRSPHTVELFDFGVAEDGAFYYVMELLEGLDADALVRGFGPIPAERAVHLLRQICHSLSEAQSCGLVHRDIKPANIFLCRYGEEYDFVKVLDFGMVKASGGTADPEPALTARNAIQGTPAFMAPEQALGRPDLDGRVDIYAIGCVAYWLLTGHLVFTAATPMGLLVHHAQTLPTAPSARTELPIPAALDQLVLSCLAKDPADRPQSARELSRRLAEIPCANPWTEDRAGSWWTKHQPAESQSRSG
jgi:eukaryotic-like serine/threonine-protein kinase